MAGTTGTAGATRTTGFGTLIVGALTGLTLITRVLFGGVVLMGGRALLGSVTCVSLAWADALKRRFEEDFLTLISTAVVEVPHSAHFLLYSMRRRPHFRQNGIVST